MALILPSTVEELNLLQNSYEFAAVSPTMYVKDSNKGYLNTDVRRTYKREVSLPNDVQNWNISNFDPYLNFDDNIPTPEIESQDDRLVPSEDDSRQRCESFSSVSSAMDDKSLIFRNMGVKTFNTVCMDSGSTCISSDHTYVTPSPSGLVKGLDAEETYQNLDTFFQQVPEIHHTDTMSSISPVGSPQNDSSLEYPIINNSYTLTSTSSQDGFSNTTASIKRQAEVSLDDDLFLMSSAKRSCESPDSSRYSQCRKKNNIASKNCRKTRKEKQKEMEIKVTELEKERESLKVEVKILEDMIQAHKLKLYAILQKR